MAEWGGPVARNDDVAYEASDWRLGAVGLVFLGILVFLVAAPLALIWGFPQSLHEVDRTPPESPPPRLQLAPAKDLAEFAAEQDRRLNTYYWLDREKGTVHIPIEEAMRKLARQAIDGFPKGGEP